ncbi:MAG: hypothetical protein RIT07_1783, partial [Bacteroidota bacterium]
MRGCNTYWIGFFVIIMSLASCEKDEPLYIAPEVPVGTQSATFAMGENYENQLWFEFATQKTASNPFGLWDIGFSLSERNSIVLNCGKHSSFSATYIENVDFKDIRQIDINRYTWTFDNPNGHPDSLSFSGCWESYQMGKAKPNNRIYIINRGADSLGNKKFIKLRLLGREGSSYHFQWGLLADTAPRHDVFINVKNEFNYAYYNFSSEKEVYNEPFNRDNWDMVI